MIENTQNNAPASGDEQMQNETVETAAEVRADSATDNIQTEQETVEPNPAKREPYDGTKKLPRTKAENMVTINACNGQIGRVDIRAASLINSHDVAKAKYAEASDFEAKREIVLADQKVVSELSDMRGYKSELESWKNELLKAEEAEINSYDFGELSW
jgi:hypothetical protein